MRRLLRWTNVLVALGPLASACAVLGSNLLEPDYRAHYRDSLPLVAAYAAFYGLVVIAFARDTRRVPLLALAKALAAYAFIATFVVLGPLWMARTPGRYVYLLFDWGAERRLVLMAFVMLGRGVWNTLNAMYFTAPWWIPLRARRPLLGRIVTMLPVGLAALLGGAFLELRVLDRNAAQAYEVAHVVFDGLDCEQIRAKQGTETTDVRERGAARFTVHIRWDCRALRVLVQDEGGEIGHYTGDRPECCTERGSSAGRSDRAASPS